MELSQAQETDILSVLAQHPIGIKNDAIFVKSTKFSDRLELSRALHQMTQVGTIYKKGELYFRVDLSPKGDDEESPRKEEPKKTIDTQVGLSRLESVTTPKEAIKAPERPGLMPPPVDKTELRTGDVRRTVGKGGVAVALYKWRKERALTLDDLEEITGSARTTLYAALASLEKEQYAVKHKTGNYITYKWSGIYKYPFPVEMGRDQELLKMDLATWKKKYYPPVDEPEAGAAQENERDQDTEPDSLSITATPTEPASSIKLLQSGQANLTMAVQVIDTQIGLHKQQLEALQTIRNLLVPA